MKIPKGQNSCEEIKDSDSISVSNILSKEVTVMTTKSDLELAAKMAGEWWADKLQQGDKVKFAKEIEARTLEALKKDGHVSLMCDYDPWDILLEAVHAIGIECRGSFFSAKGILPQKHSLLVKPDVLIPKEGYGNWTKEIKVK